MSMGQYFYESGDLTSSPSEAQKDTRSGCKARIANMGASDPPDCDWPFCGCDPAAEKVLETLQESGVCLKRNCALSSEARNAALDTDGLASAVEAILFRRALEHKLEGYTLETSIEIAAAIRSFHSQAPGYAPSFADQQVICEKCRWIGKLRDFQSHLCRMQASTVLLPVSPESCERVPATSSFDLALYPYRALGIPEHLCKFPRIADSVLPESCASRSQDSEGRPEHQSAVPEGYSGHET